MPDTHTARERVQAYLTSSGLSTPRAAANLDAVRTEAVAEYVALLTGDLAGCCKECDACIGIANHHAASFGVPRPVVPATRCDCYPHPADHEDDCPRRLAAAPTTPTTKEK